MVINSNSYKSVIDKFHHNDGGATWLFHLMRISQIEYSFGINESKSVGN